MINKETLNKLISRASKELKIYEVKPQNNYYYKALEYLKNQNYLDFEKLIKILKFSENNLYPIGYLMVNKDNKSVGFMGTFFSARYLENKNVIICNIHTWIVDKIYRINSFFLIVPIINKKYNLTAFTPVKTLEGLLLKCGLRKQALNYKLVLNFPFFTSYKNELYIEIEDKKIRDRLSKNELNYYDKFSDDHFIKILISDKKKEYYTFIISSKIKKKGINVLNFFYVSNYSFFKLSWKNISYLISRKYKVFLFSEYFFENQESIFSSNISVNIKKNFYSNNEINLKNLDILNSDLIL